jgi:hypothetical protein
MFSSMQSKNLWDFYGSPSLRKVYADQLILQHIQWRKKEHLLYFFSIHRSWSDICLKLTHLVLVLWSCQLFAFSCQMYNRNACVSALCHHCFETANGSALPSCCATQSLTTKAKASPFLLRCANGPSWSYSFDSAWSRIEQVLITITLASFAFTVGDSWRELDRIPLSRDSLNNFYP